MSRYDTIRRVNKNKVVRVGTSYLPTVEDKNSDILLIAIQGDRCDLISHQYYGSPEYWWFIASVNNLKSNNIEAGTQLRIPISIEEASLK
jgi:nucleoid-associated protein YgaU